ncbi:MAG: response regulator [Prochloraceae cyanobacterium]|nr:response regulator [Prochloraceae cyanobacterium]
MKAQIIKILLVEDNPGDAFLIQDKLKNDSNIKFELTHAEYLYQAIALLKKEYFDVILLDLLLPDSQDLETFVSIQEEAPNLPIVVLTGIKDEKIAIQAVRQGAQDYLDKQKATGETLGQAIRYAIERKLTQQQLKQHSKKLEKANRELEALNQELEAFSYSVSHDLRNPLTSINACCSLLLEQNNDRLGEETQEYIQLIRNCSHRMEEIIDDLLTLSRMKYSQIKIESVQLSAMVETITKELQQKQPQRNVEFVIEPEIEVRGDRALLQIALENLLNNAWKYSREKQTAILEFGICQLDDKEQIKNEEGENKNLTNSSQAHSAYGRVCTQKTVGLLERNSKTSFPSPPDFDRKKDTKQLVYFVRDNGVGFDMEKAEKLFTPFQRLHSASKFEGTGIGLATVQRIIHRHSGKIWCNAAVDRGATFYFTLEL